VYTHKTHEKCADILLGRLELVQLAQIGLSAVTTAGFVATVFGGNRAGAILGMLVSMALLALNSYAKSNDLATVAQKHRTAASDIWLIREKYLSLLTDLAMREKPIETLQNERDKLLRDLHAVYKGAPSTIPSAYAVAQKALKKLEDMTFSDDEVDTFLPRELKRTKR
jgi:hypothetical protein